MAAIASSPGSDKYRLAAAQLSGRLQRCWSLDLQWDLYPQAIREVSLCMHKITSTELLLVISFCCLFGMCYDFLAIAVRLIKLFQSEMG